jgi:hypothetical protein
MITILITGDMDRKFDGGTAFVANSKLPFHKGTLAERLMGFGSPGGASADTIAVTQHQSIPQDVLPLQQVHVFHIRALL